LRPCPTSKIRASIDSFGGTSMTGSPLKWTLTAAMLTTGGVVAEIAQQSGTDPANYARRPALITGRTAIASILRRPRLVTG